MDLNERMEETPNLPDCIVSRSVFPMVKISGKDCRCLDFNGSDQNPIAKRLREVQNDHLTAFCCKSLSNFKRKSNE